jgi:hypothetical protein
VAHHEDYCRARELNPTNRYLQQPKQGNAEVSHATPTYGGSQGHKDGRKMTPVSDGRSADRPKLGEG